MNISPRPVWAQVAAHFGPAAVFWVAAAILGMNTVLLRRVLPQEDARRA